MLILKWKLVGLTVLLSLIVGLISLFLLRDLRYAGSWRVCSDSYSYWTDFDSGWLVKDDYHHADLKF